MTIREKINELKLNVESPIIEPIWMEYEFEKCIEFDDAYTFYYVDEIYGYNTHVCISK